MISEKDKETIIRFAKKYEASTVILFGPSTSKSKESKSETV